jgi:CO/xanthine dehydrogenase Mo-binding subunit
VTVAPPEPKANMGALAPRLDGRDKVTGAARHPSDFPVGNPAYAFLVTSPVALGRIGEMDLAEAQSVEGILAILTHENTAFLRGSKIGRARQRRNGGGYCQCGDPRYRATHPRPPDQDRQTSRLTARSDGLLSPNAPPAANASSRRVRTALQVA